MNLFIDLKSEDLKDIFYTFGILTTFILSSVNLYIVLKNRRNTLRENLYKEQSIFISKIMSEFHNLHSDLSKLNIDPNLELDPSSKIGVIFDIIFSNAHIGSEDILLKSSETLDTALYFLKKKSADKKANYKNFNLYFTKYQNLVNIFRKELGVESLSNENKKLLR